MVKDEPIILKKKRGRPPKNKPPEVIPDPPGELSPGLGKEEIITPDQVNDIERGVVQDEPVIVIKELKEQAKVVEGNFKQSEPKETIYILSQAEVDEISRKHIKVVKNVAKVCIVAGAIIGLAIGIKFAFDEN